MKNLLVLGVTAALFYLGYDAMQPPPAPPPPRTPVAAKISSPHLNPKLYFHSALDAPAMATNMTTGTSYFSTDPNSRFTASYGDGTSGSYVGGSSTYFVFPGNSKAAAPASTNPFTAIGGAEPYRPPSQRQATPRATPNPNPTAYRKRVDAD